jgi:hypothetical protein
VNMWLPICTDELPGNPESRVDWRPIPGSAVEASGAAGDNSARGALRRVWRHDLGDPQRDLVSDSR